MTEGIPAPDAPGRTAPPTPPEASAKPAAFRLPGWARALLIAAGLAVGLGGAFWYQPRKLGAPMLTAFAVSALLLALGAGLPIGGEPDEPDEPTGAARPPRGRIAVLAALVGSAIAVALLVHALVDFRSEWRSGRGWAWFAVALALLLVSFLPLTGARPSLDARPRRGELLLFLAILGVAAAFRLHLLTSAPYGVWFDEAQNALEAKRILTDPSYRPVFVSGASQMPALSFYYFAAFVKLVGANVLAVRLGTTLAGLLAVVFVWLLGRELYGRETGLVAAGFLAVSRWHVDFSRFGMAIVFPTLFIPATLYFFVRSQQRRSARDAVIGGIVLGIGMQTYYAMFAVPLLVLLSFLHRLVTKRPRALPAVGLLALFLGSTLFAYLPVLQYARAHEAEFSERMRTVSAVNAGSLGELARVLVVPSQRRKEAYAVLTKNLLIHASMFHLHGDNNGRHNLPGAPMLDRVTGLFFAVGLIWAAVLFFEWRAATLLLWFFAMLAAGVLSLDFEAPQGARSCGLNSVIALLAALPLARVARALGAGGGRGRAVLGALPAAAALAAAGVLSWKTYFGPQLHDPEVFASFSSAETRIAEVVKAEGKAAALFIPAALIDAPAELLIVGHPIGARPFERSRDLPLATSGRPAIVFVRGHETETVDELSRMYPSATVELFGAVRQDGSRADPLLRIVRVPAAEVTRVTGLLVRYLPDSGPPAEARALTAAWNWEEAPVPAPFTAEVSGILRVERDGPFTLRVSGEAPARVELDGEELLRAGESRTVTLARGSHRLSLVARVASRAGATELRWSGAGIGVEAPIGERHLFAPAIGADGLLGAYHAGAACTGEPAFRQIDPEVAFYFHLIPLQRPFSICWSGSLFAPEKGTYRLGTSSIDSSSVALDGHIVAENTKNNELVDGAVELERGWHAIDVRYDTSSNYSQVYLYWMPPGRTRGLVPSARLRPPGPSGRRTPRDAPAPEP